MTPAAPPSPHSDPRGFLRALFEIAVGAADPAVVLPGRLPPPPPGRTVVVGAGKAAASMARVVDDHWPGSLSGLVVTRYGHGMPCRRIEVVEASHPMPDARGRRAAARILTLAQHLTADDLLLCLFSGGGSALLALPAPGITLEEKRTVNTALLRCGAPIDEMNCVRKHLSAIKGGRLAAAAHPARVVTYLISDVPGDDPSVIASGPTVPDPTTFADALAVLSKYGIDTPPAIKRHLLTGAAAAAQPTDALPSSRPLVAPFEDRERPQLMPPPTETPKPGDPGFARDELVMLAAPADALAAASRAAERAGVSALVLGDDVQGEARAVGEAHADLATRMLRSRPSDDRPLVVLSGGETTVTLTGSGRGGRNAEYLLSAVIALNGRPGIWALACDTDGIDGSEDNAGALATPDTLSRAAAAGLNPSASLMANDAYGFFSALHDLVLTGPTRTNVNDFRAFLLVP